MDAGHRTLDNGHRILDKRTTSIESIIAPTRFIASIVEKIWRVNHPSPDNYRDPPYYLYLFRTTPQPPLNRPSTALRSVRGPNFRFAYWSKKEVERSSTSFLLFHFWKLSGTGPRTERSVVEGCEWVDGHSLLSEWGHSDERRFDEQKKSPELCRGFFNDYLKSSKI